MVNRANKVSDLKEKWEESQEEYATALVNEEKKKTIEALEKAAAAQRENARLHERIAALVEMLGLSRSVSDRLLEMVAKEDSLWKREKALMHERELWLKGVI